MDNDDLPGQRHRNAVTIAVTQNLEYRLCSKGNGYRRLFDSDLGNQTRKPAISAGQVLRSNGGDEPAATLTMLNSCLAMRPALVPSPQLAMAVLESSLYFIRLGVWSPRLAGFGLLEYPASKEHRLALSESVGILA